MHFFEDLQDAALVSRVQGGDMFALQALIERYQPVLYVVAEVMLGDAVKARELTRATLLGTYMRMSELDKTCGFLSSAHSLLINECLALLRRTSVQPSGAPVADGPAAGRPGEAAAFRSLPFDERCRRMRAALLQIVPERRAIVVLRHLAGLSYGEIALTLDLPIERVRGRLHAARQQLGEWLLGWPRATSLDARQEDLLQRHIDGALDHHEREAREHLLSVNRDAFVRAAALRDLGRSLNALTPVGPPINLASQVLTWVEFLTPKRR
jgi:RNA polymerase sigma-70 factor, ECF subfamily